MHPAFICFPLHETVIAAIYLAENFFCIFITKIRHLVFFMTNIRVISQMPPAKPEGLFDELLKAVYFGTA
jgi:hypothetical protein